MVVGSGVTVTPANAGAAQEKSAMPADKRARVRFFIAPLKHGFTGLVKNKREPKGDVLFFPVTNMADDEDRT